MTSLSSQLQSLRTAVAQQQTVERRHVSLLFAKKEAEVLDRETIYNIGCTGLRKLKQLDPEFLPSNDLFEESRQHFQRSLITNEENIALNEKIEKLLFQLSPYVQHFACQQVLEWLIFKYQIYAYNAESLILTFIPFHETNLFGRLLSILDYNFATSKDWSFLEGFSKKEYPVPFSSIVKSTASSTHSLITRIGDHLNRGIQLVGKDFLEKKCHVLFTFYAKLLIAVLEESSKIDDSLLAKIIPLLASGLKSALPSFRETTLMVICQLVIAVKLTPDVVASLTKAVLMKFRLYPQESTLPTLIVICQQQVVESLPRKAILKMLRAEQNIWTTLKGYRETTDLTPLLSALWTTLFSIANEESYEEDHKQCLYALRETSCPEDLYASQAAIFLTKLLQYPELRGLDDNKKFGKHVYSMVARFSDQWQKVCEEWTSRDERVLANVVRKYDLEPLMVVHAPTELRKKRTRRRSGSTRKSFCDPGTADEPQAKNALERAEIMASSSEFVRRLEFVGDPLKKAREWIKKEKWDKVSWAFDEMGSRKSYFSDKVDGDIEKFVLEVIQVAVKNPNCPVIEKASSVLAEVKLRSDFVIELLSPYNAAAPAPKKLKSSTGGNLAEAFGNETREEYEKRLCFVVDMLNRRRSPVTSVGIFRVLFSLLKGSCGEEKLFTIPVMNLLLTMLRTSDKREINPADLEMDFVVEMMRTTYSHRVLRQSLRLLTAAARLSPSTVTSHVMSVFTFMGNGLFRKDNELTLGIIEDTIEGLFRAVCEQDGKTPSAEMHTRLASVTRILAASTHDIPAHRRSRIARAIVRAVNYSNVWIIVGVLVEHFCARWQRSIADDGKRSLELDAFDDFAIEICTVLDPVYQFSVVLDLLNFIVRLGGDRLSHRQEAALDQAVFDRSKYSLPKLRHFRFMTMGLVVRVLSNRNLFEKLGVMDDDDLYRALLPVGRRLIISSVELDEFIAGERALAEETEEQQTHRYWVALSGRAETVSDKLRHLLPGAIAATVITDILEDEKADWRIREKALHLANYKLVHDEYFSNGSESSVQHLERMAFVLNKWIVKERSSPEQDVLCQNAAISLRLVTKRLCSNSNTSVFIDTMSKCIDIVSEYKTLDDCLVGNILLLAGELVRYLDVKSTLVSAVPLLTTSLKILDDCISGDKDLDQKQIQQENISVKRARTRLQSFSKRKTGGQPLLVSVLTCVQRIMDQFAPFVSQFLPEILVNYCRLSGRLSDSVEDSACTGAPVLEKSQTTQTTKNSVAQRLGFIRSSLLKLELRIIPKYFARAVIDLRHEEKSLICLFSLLANYFEQKNRAAITYIRDTLLKDVFLKGLEFRGAERTIASSESINNVERSVFKSFMAMAEVLTENTLRSVVNGLVEWAEEGLKPSATDNERSRLITVYSFAKSFYDSFNTLSLPYFGRLLEMSVRILNACNATVLGDSTMLLISSRKGTNEEYEADVLIVHVIDFISNCARHREFLTKDQAEKLIEPLVNELVNIKVNGHENRCRYHLSNALYHLADTHPDLFQVILDKLLLKTRSSKAKIRYRGLLVMEALLDKVGDGVAPHLPTVIPFLSELLEDENRNVEGQCDRVVRLLQSKFGENICEGFM
ncbi:hypothetical protein V3C99_012135 [Haemonchus contortus]